MALPLVSLERRLQTDMRNRVALAPAEISGLHSKRRSLSHHTVNAAAPNTCNPAQIKKTVTKSRPVLLSSAPVMYCDAAPVITPMPAVTPEINDADFCEISWTPTPYPATFKACNPSAPIKMTCQRTVISA